MSRGYIGKMLFVDLSKWEIKEELLDEKICYDFIGGYGIGARIIYNLQRAGIDPLGPENIFGLFTGPLTGTPATLGCRYTAMAKSPLTLGWGDANAGGSFGPNLKFAGYDGIFFTGISEKPAYLFIDNGKPELRDAARFWGKDTYETEDMIRNELGKGTEMVCIGPSGEKRSLIASIISDRGAAAARSGLGAVMGSKKLKAVAVRGNQKIPIVNVEEVNKLRLQHIAAMRAAKSLRGSFLDDRHRYGTTASTDLQTHSGDAPVKNWGGIGVVDFPEISEFNPEVSIANLLKRSGCWHCSIACEGELKAGTGEYKYPAGIRRVEYETQAAFGSMCLNNNVESINMANHICNSYGLDTISTGGTIAFAIECYENGLIDKSDTDGIEMTWGNHRSIIAMTQKMALREGFGEVLADGVKVAAEKIGKGADKYAIHIGGQEPAMHDPKLVKPPRPFQNGAPPAARYQMDATPGRHTQGFGPPGFHHHLINTSGLCMFGYGPSEPAKYVAGFMAAVTGWDRSIEELFKAAEKIANIRHVFTLREGINPLERKVPDRMIGNPPQKVGPLAGITADIKNEIYTNLAALDWDPITTKPSKKRLLELGLDDIARDFWP